jgi:hypothetical protein
MSDQRTDAKQDRRPFAEIMFAIPAQRFAITCAISTEETMPVVTEFAMRMIYTCGTVGPAQLQTFFGFSDKEASAVIRTLVDEGLVRWEEEQLALTPQALERFLESPDKVPRCFRIQEWTGDVFFELISFRPIKRGSARSRALVELRVPDSKKESKTIYWAERAFQENFREICRKRHAEIYKISEMDAGERASLSLPCNFTVSIDGRCEIQRSIPDATLEESLEFSAAISDALAKGVRSPNKGLAEMFSGFKIDLPFECLTGGEFDLARYLDYVYVLGRNPYPAGARPFLGSPFLRDNRKAIIDQLSAVPKRSEEAIPASGSLPPICWLAPNVPLWGRTTATRNFIQTMDRFVKGSADLPPGSGDEEADERDEVAVTTIVSSSQVLDPKLRAAYRAAIPGGVDLDTTVLDGKIELFWVPGELVVVLYHYHADHPIPIPVGFISTHPDHLSRVRDLIVNDAIGSRPAYDLTPGTGGFGKESTYRVQKFKEYKL